ncbi:MAG TPA: SDR family oxidoreductase [Actinomycetota bacterium]|nr:SDR family oxidoreductase [Actinomycetota bacterium]
MGTGPAPGREPHPPLAGTTALVTGAGRGLGRAIAAVLSDAGARVFAADVAWEDEQAAGGNEPIPARGIEPILLDVADRGSVRAAVEAVEAAAGPIRVVVNNAGIDVTAPFEEIDPATWDRIIDVNLRGPANVSRAVWGSMRRAGGGSIVNVVSTAARRAWANASAYHASKWGLLGFSHALHVEGREAGIRVTAVIAGGMRTPFLLDRFPGIDPSTLQEPEAVAAAVRFAVTQPEGTVIPEIMVVPTAETSWP